MPKFIYRALYWLYEKEATWRQDYNEANYWNKARRQLDD